MILEGSWKQTVINLSNAAPGTGWSQAWFYGVGVLLGISSGVILLMDVWDSLRNFKHPLVPPTSLYGGVNHDEL